jgi:hypothetical protein
MDLVHIPHFGCGKNMNNCIKKLLELVNGGISCLYMPIFIDIDQIRQIIGLPTSGEKPE